MKNVTITINTCNNKVTVTIKSVSFYYGNKIYILHRKAMIKLTINRSICFVFDIENTVEPL